MIKDQAKQNVKLNEGWSRSFHPVVNFQAQKITVPLYAVELDVKAEMLEPDAWAGHQTLLTITGMNNEDSEVVEIKGLGQTLAQNLRAIAYLVEAVNRQAQEEGTTNNYWPEHDKHPDNR